MDKTKPKVWETSIAVPVSIMRRDILQQICDILDTDGLWLLVAPVMPEIEVNDVEGCKRHEKNNQSPTRLLFQVWAAKGYTTNHLFQVFAKMRLQRCMKMMMPVVDERLHYLMDKMKSPAKNNSSTKSRATLQHQPSLQSSQQSQPSNQAASSFSATRFGRNETPSNASTSSVHSSSSQSQDPLRVAIEGTLPVSYLDLSEATRNFHADNIIGKGGYGVVYRGELKATGGTVAVKRIMASNDPSAHGARIEKERLRQSLQELRTLARFRHDNILPIYAYSLEGPEPCLVYQFMANGSLEDRLLCRKGTKPLNWTQKKTIGLGSARGILFLHSFAKTPIIHGDVKTANILLDKHMEPKLGDFGLSRDGQIEEKNPLIASHIKGTLAYLPPEFITSKILSTKLDVYSFGIVLLEIATGLRAYSDSREPRSLIEYCQVNKDNAQMKIDMLKSALRDKRTPLAIDTEEEDMFEIFLELGLAGSQRDREKRPAMKEVVEILNTSSIASLANLTLT